MRIARGLVRRGSVTVASNEMRIVSSHFRRTNELGVWHSTRRCLHCSIGVEGRRQKRRERAVGDAAGTPSSEGVVETDTSIHEDDGAAVDAEDDPEAEERRLQELEHFSRPLDQQLEEHFEEYSLDEHISTAAFRMMKGRYGEAVRHYDHLVNFGFALDDDNVGAVVFFSRARCRQELGMYDEAVEDYLSALQFPRSRVQAIAGIGHCLAAQGKYDAAIKRYGECLHLLPSFSEAQVGLGNALLRQGKPLEARENFLAVQGRERANAGALLGLGDAYYLLGKNNVAMSVYSTAMDVCGPRIAALDNRQLDDLPPLPFDTEDEDLVIIEGNEALVQAAHVWKGIAMCELAKERFTQGRDAIKTARKLCPAEAKAVLLDILHKEAMFHLLNDDADAALRVTEEAAAVSGGEMPSSFAQWHARALGALGRHEDCVWFTKDFLDCVSSTGDVHKHVALGGEETTMIPDVLADLHSELSLAYFRLAYEEGEAPVRSVVAEHHLEDHPTVNPGVTAPRHPDDPIASQNFSPDDVAVLGEYYRTVNPAHTRLRSALRHAFLAIHLQTTPTEDGFLLLKILRRCAHTQ